MAIIAEKAVRRRRAEVVRAAALLFSQRGYHGTSMQHLGNALGLQRGSLYAHIGSKEELLFEVVEDGADRFLRRARWAARLESTASERLRALLIGHVETAADHLEAATVFLNEWRYLSTELRSAIQAKRDEYESIARGIVADGIADGDFRAGTDVFLAATLVLSAGNWTYTWYRPGGELTASDIGRELADLVIKGLTSSRPLRPGKKGSDQ